MADNVTIPAQGTGTSTPVIATDDIGGVHYQLIKLGYGALDAFTIITGSVGMPTVLLAGAASIGILGANSGVDIGDVTINNTAGASAVNIQDGGNSITVDGSITVSSIPVRVRTADSISTSDSTDAVMQSGNIPLAVLRRPVHVTTDGQILISGVSNRKLRVLGGFLISSAALTASIKSGNNQAASGPLPLLANEGFIIPYIPAGNFETLAGQNLTISLSAAGTIGGWLSYVEV